MDLPLVGGCLCGAVRYRCTLPTATAGYCHCRSCRRAAGAHAVAWFTVGVGEYRFDTVAPAEFASSPGVRRGHCPGCGTTLTYWSARYPDTIDITVASLDDPALMPPVKHIWMEDAVVGDSGADGLPRFLRSSDGAGAGY
jgi:hypothetical protein